MSQIDWTYVIYFVELCTSTRLDLKTSEEQAEQTLAAARLAAPRSRPVYYLTDRDSWLKVGPVLQWSGV